MDTNIGVGAELKPIKLGLAKFRAKIKTGSLKIRKFILLASLFYLPSNTILIFIFSSLSFFKPANIDDIDYGTKY